MTTKYLAADITGDEGRVLKAYLDTVGIWTNGVGHAHVAPGCVWTDKQCDDALAADIAKAETDLDRSLPWWRTLNHARQDVLVNMAFNLGITRLLGFKNTLAAMKAGRFDAAAKGMMASLWARQVGRRAVRLAAQMKTGVRA